MKRSFLQLLLMCGLVLVLGEASCSYPRPTVPHYYIYGDRGGRCKALKGEYINLIDNLTLNPLSWDTYSPSSDGILSAYPNRVFQLDFFPTNLFTSNPVYSLNTNHYSDYRFTDGEVIKAREQLGDVFKEEPITSQAPVYIYLDTFFRIEVHLLEDLDDTYKQGSLLNDITRFIYTQVNRSVRERWVYENKDNLLSDFNAMDVTEKMLMCPPTFRLLLLRDHAASYRSRFPDGLRVRLTVYYRKWEGDGKEYSFSKDMVMQTISG